MIRNFGDENDFNEPVVNINGRNTQPTILVDLCSYIPSILYSNWGPLGLFVFTNASLLRYTIYNIPEMNASEYDTKYHKEHTDKNQNISLIA